MYNYPNYLQNLQPNYQNIAPQTQNNNLNQDERIWVSNQQAAESFLISPSSFVRLWDSSKPVFYEKRADITGRPLPMDIYEYKRVLPQITTPTEEVNKISYDEIEAKIEAINERIDKLEQIKKGTTKNAKQPATDDTSV